MRALGDHPREFVFESQRVDPAESTQPTEIEATLFVRGAEEEITATELELPGRVIGAVGLESQLPVIVEILDEKRIVEIDHHGQVVALGEIVITEVTVEQDPIVALGLAPESIRYSLHDRNRRFHGLSFVRAVGDGQSHAMAGAAQDLGECDKPRPDTRREPANGLRADHEDPAQRSPPFKHIRNNVFMGGW